MRILFFSTVFAPSVGGIEKLAETLCNEFVALGHEVCLATLTPGEGDFPYPVHRCPSLVEFWKLLIWCDVHVQANVSLKHAWPLIVTPKKFFFQHNTAYQRDDGSRGFRDFLKVGLGNTSCSIANSRYTARRTGASHVVLNAYEDRIFRVQKPWNERPGDLVFLGRLVSQKGCDTLLEALDELRRQGLRPSLTIIGDGPDKILLEARCAALDLTTQVQFVGILQGDPLAKELNRHRVLVVPSCYEEPFGIVALEGLACGCLPIVSERGGLVDAIAGYGFTFPNGDHIALARVLAEVLRDDDTARARLNGVEEHLAQCSARAVAERYIEIFQNRISPK